MKFEMLKLTCEGTKRGNHCVNCWRGGIIDIIDEIGAEALKAGCLLVRARCARKGALRHGLSDHVLGLRREEGTEAGADGTMSVATNCSITVCGRKGSYTWMMIPKALATRPVPAKADEAQVLAGKLMPSFLSQISLRVTA